MNTHADPERSAQGARRVALDQIEIAARAGRREQLEYWVERLCELDRRRREETS